MSGLSGTTIAGTVPIVFSYRRVTKRPKIERTRRFVGLKRVFGTLVHRAIEWVEELAYEVQDEVMDAGREEAVHWALQVDDPWGPSAQSQLIVTRMPDRPACGANFEIIRIEEPQSQPDTPERARRPANFEQARSRMREMLQREEHYAADEELEPAPAPEEPGYAQDHLARPQISPAFPPSNGDGV